MHVLLFLAGVISAGAGVATVAYGFVNPAFHLSDAMLMSASIGAVGGLLMIGLGSALLHLRRIGEALEMRPVAQDVGALPPMVASSEGMSPPVTNPPMTLPAPILQRSPAAETQTVASAAAAETPAAANDEAGAPAGHSPPMRPAMNAPAAAVAAALDLGTSAEAGDAHAAEPERRILKSGVIEGMAYSLYSDGSVDAELKDGQRHFESISAWRAHMREVA